MAEYIECRDCDSPYCDGCNLYILAKMLHRGELDCLMDEHRTIVKAPAVDAVGVVRCKDCVHAREMDKYEKRLYLDECVGCTFNSTSYYPAIMMPDDFCSNGERRADDEQS